MSRLSYAIQAERHSRQKKSGPATPDQLTFLERLDVELDWPRRSYGDLSKAEASAAIELRLRAKKRVKR